FLLSSISEGIPLTVIEAMAAGVPVVSTGVGGIPEVVEEGRTGMLAPAGDAEALAAKVHALVDNAPLRNDMTRRARERAHDRFSERLMHSRYGELYSEMLPCSNGHHAY